MLKKNDLEITQQVTETVVLEIVDETGNPRNLSGYDFQLDCRQQPNSENVYFTMSSADQTIQLDSVDQHKIILYFTHDLTKSLNFDVGLYDLMIFKPDRSSVEVIVSGKVHLKKTITKLP